MADEVSSGVVRNGLVISGLADKVWSGDVSAGGFWQIWSGVELHGGARFVEDWQLWNGLARPGAAWFGKADMVRSVGVSWGLRG